MGNWNISIQGTGQHHNKHSYKDANRMAAEFVQRLRDAGHTVTHAFFTHGCVDCVDAGKGYLETQDEIEK
ncbi:MAG: hypothetical protein HY323_07220 [Betaproteobacteria bacterium]|nr:hypothetical protein [Betaproteobacteria bacterium]